MKKTKIVATIGPASEDKEKLIKMVKGGMNVIRLNFSHNKHSWHGEVIDRVREVSKELNAPIGILADMQGPRIRVGNEKEFLARKGDEIFISDKKTKREKELVIDKKGVSSALQPKERILIEDGLIELKVVEKKGKTIKAKVINGGIIKPRKGMNVPDTSLKFGAVTEKDKKDLEFVVKKGVDFVALSFVSNAKEIEDTRKRIEKILKRKTDLPYIVPKIERKEAIKNIKEIVKASDAVMVARGDLGIEMEESKVILYQKRIIKECLKGMKSVIVATQMLNSMIDNPIPTRAEVSDVSNAVIDHADAVMLSGESAGGKYPIRAVTVMNEIVKDTEESPYDDKIPTFLDKTISDYASVVKSSCELAKKSKAKAIIMASASGFTARLVSHYRPDQKLFVATNNFKTYNQLALVWGVRVYYYENRKNLEGLIEIMVEDVKKQRKLRKGDKVVVVLGRVPGKTDMHLVGIKEID